MLRKVVFIDFVRYFVRVRYLSGPQKRQFFAPTTDFTDPKWRASTFASGRLLLPERIYSQSIFHAFDALGAPLSSGAIYALLF